MIKQYKHILIILLDGILQVQANKDEKPLYRATAKEHECDEYKLNYTDWVLNHQYFLFASKEEERKTLDYLQSLTQDINIEDGTEIDCIEIVKGLSLNGIPTYVTLAYFKPNEIAQLTPSYGNSTVMYNNPNDEDSESQDDMWYDAYENILDHFINTGGKLPECESIVNKWKEQFTIKRI